MIEITYQNLLAEIEQSSLCEHYYAKSPSPSHHSETERPPALFQLRAELWRAWLSDALYELLGLLSAWTEDFEDDGSTLLLSMRADLDVPEKMLILLVRRFVRESVLAHILPSLKEDADHTAEQLQLLMFSCEQGVAFSN